MYNITDVRNQKHISRKLNFIKDSDTRDTATLPDGIKVHRITDKKGIAFSIFFNTREEWMYLRNKYFGKSYIHFYGGNYIYIPPHCNLIHEICDIMKWENKDESTWFYPY